MNWRLWGPPGKTYHLGGLTWSPKFCISKKFPTDSNSAGSGPILKMGQWRQPRLDWNHLGVATTREAWVSSLKIMI